jgi:hypothetical protein
MPVVAGLHEPAKMLQHSELINAIMIDIMPGLLQMCFQSYTAEMIKGYFRRVREEQVEALKNIVSPVPDMRIVPEPDQHEHVSA